MARKKVQLSWIAHAGARKVSYRKRKEGLVKKFKEFSTLCGVDTCLILNGPQDLHETTMVWPSHEKIYELMTRFDQIPQIERSKKGLNREIYLTERIAKAKKHLNKDVKSNEEIENNLLDLKDFNLNDINGLKKLMEEKLNLINKRKSMVLSNGEHQLALAITDYAHVLYLVSNQLVRDNGQNHFAPGDFLEWANDVPPPASQLDYGTWGWYPNLMDRSITTTNNLSLYDPMSDLINGGSQGGMISMVSGGIFGMEQPNLIDEHDKFVIQSNFPHGAPDYAQNYHHGVAGPSLMIEYGGPSSSATIANKNGAFTSYLAPPSKPSGV